MQDFPSVMRNCHEHIDRFEEQRSDDKEINPGNVWGVVFQESPPSLAFIGVGLWLTHILGYGIIADIKAQLCQLTLNPLRRPERIFSLQSSVQNFNFIR